MTFTPDAEAAIDAKLAQLDLETKVKILSGQDFWSLPAVPEIGLASIVMSDGPVGVRGTSWTADDPSIAHAEPDRARRDLGRRTSPARSAGCSGRSPGARACTCCSRRR